MLNLIKRCEILAKDYLSDQSFLEDLESEDNSVFGAVQDSHPLAEDSKRAEPAILDTAPD